MHETTIAKPDIDLYQFRLLLQDLESSRDIFIRVKLKGELWMEHFSNVLVFTPHAIVLCHMQTRTIKYIKNINDIVGFEINRSYMIFKPFEHYNISPFSEDLKITHEGLRYG